MLRLRTAMKAVEISEQEVEHEMMPGSILARSSKSVTNTLERFRNDEIGLVSDINALNERLRQTRIAINAFEAAADILDGADGKPIGDAGTVGRLVPREVPA